MPGPFTFPYLVPGFSPLTLLLTSKAIMVRGQEITDQLKFSNKPIRLSTLESGGVCTCYPIFSHRNGVTKGRSNCRRYTACNPSGTEDEGMLAGVSILQNQ